MSKRAKDMGGSQSSKKYIYFRHCNDDLHKKFDEGKVSILAVRDQCGITHFLTRSDEISKFTGKKKIIDENGREAIDLHEEAYTGGIVAEKGQPPVGEESSEMDS